MAEIVKRTAREALEKALVATLSAFVDKGLTEFGSRILAVEQRMSESREGLQMIGAAVDEAARRLEQGEATTREGYPRLSEVETGAVYSSEGVIHPQLGTACTHHMARTQSNLYLSTGFGLARPGQHARATGHTEATAASFLVFYQRDLRGQEPARRPADLVRRAGRHSAAAAFAGPLILAAGGYAVWALRGDTGADARRPNLAQGQPPPAPDRRAAAGDTR